MPRIARVVVSNIPHHVTQRGNRRQGAARAYSNGTTVGLRCFYRKLGKGDWTGTKEAQSWEAKKVKQVIPAESK